MKLFFDTETTGFPQDRLAPEHPDQAHLVELGAQLWDGDRLMQAVSLIVDPGDVTFSEGAVNAHGITPERAKAEGVPPQVALRAFAQMAKLADEAVAHNAQFDVKIIGLAAKRLGVEIPLPRVTCTMQIATPLTKIANGYGRGFKWPKLEEAFRHFYPERPFEHAHSAYYDCTYCRDIYMALQARGHILEKGAA
jgi:DNA polymerase-3 subunit epsilon